MTVLEAQNLYLHFSSIAVIYLMIGLENLSYALNTIFSNREQEDGDING